MNKAVFLDRDGTIARDVNYCHRVEDFEILPNAPEAIKLLIKNGFKIVIITNQSGIARGYFTEEILAQIHQKMKDELSTCDAQVDAIYYCPHHPDDGCECRKPKTALFNKAAKEFDIDLQNSFIIGDRQMDIDAGKILQCKTVLVTTGPSPPDLNPQYPTSLPDYVATNLLEAAEWIVTNRKGVSIIIPVRDKVNTVSALIPKIRESLNEYLYEIAVVYDGSGEDTSTLARDRDVMLISHGANLGKGAAMKNAAQNASGDILVFLDSDGAHDPKDIPRVIAPILEGKAELTIGSRTLPESRVITFPLTRKLSNNVASLIISIVVSFLLPLASLFNHTGKLLKLTRPTKPSQPITLKFIRITDCTSGFRAISRKGWKSLVLTSQGFEIETEMIYEAAKKGFVITEIPISCKWDNQSSQLSIWRDGLKTIRLLARKLISDIKGDQV